MREKMYFAVFELTKTGYSVFFPDVLGVITVGGNIHTAVANAKEALGLRL